MAATTALDELDACLAADPAGRGAAATPAALALRHRAALAPRTGCGPATWPPALPDPAPDQLGLPELSPTDLSVDRVCGGLLHHGAVVVRGLVASDDAAELADGVDRAFAAADRWLADRSADVAPWFHRFPSDNPTLGNLRRWVRDSGAVWAAECPPVAGRVLALYAAAGLRPLLTEYFGERPALSVNKFTLRRAAPSANPTWHQDGAFLGDGVRSVNVWVTLTDCGGDEPVPALDLVPTRIDDILETGTRGAGFANAIGHELVVETAAEHGIVRPTFAAGDALIFDERFVHRTATDAAMTADRYAIESWFFSPSHYPPSYVPILF